MVLGGEGRQVQAELSLAMSTDELCHWGMQEEAVLGHCCLWLTHGLVVDVLAALVSHGESSRARGRRVTARILVVT